MEPGDLESRVDALEHQVQDLTGRVGANEQDSATARMMAGSADRDVSALRGELAAFRAETAANFDTMRTETAASVDALRAETAANFQSMRAETAASIDALRTETAANFKAVRADARAFRRATTATSNALREDISDLRQQFDRGFAEMRGRLDATAAGMQTIVDLLRQAPEGQ